MLSVGPVGPVGHELPPTVLLLLTPENALSLISLFVYTLYIFSNIYIYQTQQKNTKKNITKQQSHAHSSTLSFYHTHK